jgi:DNA-binding transcriptional LysR family regulator
VLPRGDALRRKDELSLRDLLDRAFVGLPRESALQRHLGGHPARLGATLKVRARVTGFDTICRMVESGAGVAIMPQIAAERCRRVMRIDLVRLGDAWASRRLAVCVRKLAASPAGAKRLVEHLRRPAAE